MGTGLIGCSFTLALKKAGYNGHIVGYARNQSTLDAALARQCIDSASLDATCAVDGADLVMLTVPMLAMEGVLKQIASELGQDTIVTDGGSVKGSFVSAAQRHLTRLENLVPGHPIAGRELSGVAAAQEDLFLRKRVLLTPLPQTRPEATAAVSSLWKMAGAEVETIDVEAHDRVLALTSHLPHVLAFALVDMLAQRQEHEEIFRYAAGGFRDFTRIASGDPVMWRDICLSNREQISEAVTALMDNLVHLKSCIDDSDHQQLLNVFARAKDARDRHTKIEIRSE